jgi:RNA polymerase sigma-70 factor (ECF subfamily)
VLERHDVRAADPARGRFRSFLLSALQHYVINEHERDTAVKRGGRVHGLSLDFDEVERTYVLEGRNDDSPDRVFNRKWAAISLDRALHRLREECHAAGKGTLADALLPYLTDTGNLPPYRTVAEQLGLTEGATKVAVHRLRQRFGVILRLEIAETVLAPGDVDDEVRELIRALSAS